MEEGFSRTGGMACEFYKRLAGMISTKQEKPYSQAFSWLQTLILLVMPKYKNVSL